MNRRVSRYLLFAFVAVVTMPALAVPDAVALSFATPVPYAVGTGPYSVAAGDFNGDTHPDLVAGNRDSGSFSVLLNDTHGAFGAKIDTTVGANPNFVAVGYFDGDGKLDVAVCNLGGGTTGIYLGTGDGTFTLKGNLTGGYGEIVVADLNGDAKADLVVSDSHSSGKICVFLGNGDGTFSAKTEFAAGTTTGSVAVSDFNGDGKKDVVAGNYNDDTVSVFLGNGSGSFATPAPTYSTGTDSGPAGVAVGDFNGDGHQDLAVADSDDTTGAVSVLLGAGDGTFGAYTEYATNLSPRKVFVGDFNGDDVVDLATANAMNNSINVLPGAGNGTFGLKVAADAGSSSFPVGLAAADFDSDGKLDLATANLGSANVSVIINQGGAPTGTMALNDGADATAVPLVTVDATVFGAKEMRLRDQGGTWGSWVAFDDDAPWTLPAVEGPHTVDVEYRNKWSQTLALSDYIALDQSPPVTAAEVTSPTARASGWYKQSVEVTLSPLDWNSGVASVEYSTNGGTDWTPGSTVTTTVDTAGHTTDGDHTITFRSTDEVGNVETPKTFTFHIDTVKPTLTGLANVSVRHGKTAALKYRVLDTASNGGTATVTIKVRNKAGKVVKTIKAGVNAIDTAFVAKWAVPRSLKPGVYRYSVYATDSAGNLQAAVKSARVTVR